MPLEQHGGRATPHLPKRRQLTVRQLANKRRTAPLACFVVLISASVAACTPQLDSAVLANHGRHLSSSDLSVPAHRDRYIPATIGPKQASRSLRSEQATVESRRLMLAPDVQTAQQAAQQAVNRWLQNCPSVHGEQAHASRCLQHTAARMARWICASAWRLTNNV